MPKSPVTFPELSVTMVRNTHGRRRVCHGGRLQHVTQLRLALGAERHRHRQPFDERPGLETYAAPAPLEVTARYRTFCGT